MILAVWNIKDFILDVPSNALHLLPILDPFLDVYCRMFLILKILIFAYMLKDINIINSLQNYDLIIYEFIGFVMMKNT